MSNFQTNEKHLSQIPALQLLIGLGFEFLTPAEALRERQDRTYNVLLESILRNQLNSGLANLTSEEVHDVVVAYEPIWAVGTGKLPKPDDVKVAAEVIRRQIDTLFGKNASENIRVLYGGSINSQSARNYLDIEGIDGLLIGSASLQANSFEAIVEIAQQKVMEEQ